jgi:transcriptional regulator with XRE-family HTH domain
VQKSIHTAAYATFLEILIEVRTRAGITQKQLGNELPFEQPMISKMERGERRIDIIELKLICETLGITLGDFVRELEKRLNERNN